MTTKVDKFVTEASLELADIRTDFEQVALKAQVLVNRWAALGKTNMDGWAGYNWSGMQFTAAELATALNGLSQVIDTTDGVNLTNVHTACKAVDKIVKAGL